MPEETDLLGQIGRIAGIAVRAGTALTSVSQSVKLLSDIIRPGDKFDPQLVELVEKLGKELAEARLANQQAEIAALRFEREMREMDAFQRDMQRYHLQQTDMGAFVYMLRPECQGGEPLHCLCPDCHARGHKSVLQPHPTGNWLVCAQCPDATFQQNLRGQGRLDIGWDPLDPYGD